MKRKEEILQAANNYKAQFPDGFINEQVYIDGAEWADRTHWKPSKKQLDALNDILDVLKITERFNNHHFYTLKELYNDLIKL